MSVGATHTSDIAYSSNYDNIIDTNHNQSQASHKDEFDLQCEQMGQKQHEIEEYIAVIEKLRQNLFANEMEVRMMMTVVSI